MAKTIPLTATEVKQAKPKQKGDRLIVNKLSDGEGLQLRVNPNGAKIWLLDFINPYTKKRTSMSFGAYPAVSLADARKLKLSARELLAKGLNPKTERDNERRLIDEANNNTLEHITLKWFEVKKNRISASYGKDIMGSLSRHIFPKLGNVPLNKLTAPEVIAVLRPIATSGKLETVKRICQRINEIMTYSLNTGLITDNPLAGINKAFEVRKTKHFPTLKPEELPELTNALDVASIKLVTRCLIEWQLHTMCRPKEGAGARWDEIDFDEKLWIIPEHRMKAKREHRIPLTKQTLGLLEFLKPISGHREFIFPSNTNPRTHMNESSANVALKRMGFKGRLVAHGMRGLARTTLADQGFNHEALEACLAHQVGTVVSQAYNHSTYMSQRVKIMAWWSNHIEQASVGNMSLSGRKGLKIING